GLRLLEIDFRERTLRALADWERLGIAGPEWLAAVPELFLSIAALQRPSWGHWNGLMTALRKARQVVQQEGGDDLRGRLEAVGDLNRELDRLDTVLEPTVARLLKPLAQVAHARPTGKLRMNHALALPIMLRNRVVHDMPTDPAWWLQAAQALRPLPD